MKASLLLLVLSLVYFNGFGQCVIISQPVAPSPVCWNGIGTVPSLSVTATGTNLSYQWYSNTTNSNSGGTIAAGQSGSAVYTPVITGAGTIYYYVVVSGDCGTVTSNAVPVTVVTGVSIISQSTLTGQQFCVGSTVPTLTVVASGVNLGYQWYRNTVPSFNNAIAIPGANGASYTPPATTIGTTYYYVTITGGCGAPLTLNSNPVPVTVTSGTGTAITTQPAAPAPLCNGGPQPLLTVAATGNNLSYTWFKNTVNSNTGGVAAGSSSTFTTPNLPGTNYYYVTVQGSCGSATSNAVAVIDPLTAVGVQVQNNGPVNPCLNGAGPLFTASLTSGGNTGGVGFQWYSNTANSNSGGTAISGATAVTYKPPTSAAGTTSYYVIATGYCNAIVSSATPVTVNTLIGASITAQPAAATTVCLNGTAPVLSVAANGTNLLYQWYSNTANSNSGGTPINGANANTYTAPVTTAGTTWYYVTVGSICGVVTSNAAAVNVVNGTAITSQPVAPPQVCANGNAPMLSITALASNPVYQWYSNTTNSNSGGNAISGANGSVYTPVLTAAGTNVFYYVTVTGDCGAPLSVTSNAVPVSVVAATTITTSPQINSLSCINSPLPPLSANATGPGQLIFQWYSNTVNSNSGGSVINGATNPQYTPPNTAGGTVYYYETVTSGCGTVTSNQVSLTLVGAPKIITQPVAPPTICVNSASPELTVGASGTNLAYQWYSNTVNSNTGGNAINGANSDSYIPPVNAVGTTYYYAVINADVIAGGAVCASAISNAVAVNVSGGTAITSQPISPAAVCTNGEPPLLSVTADGTGISYQWFSNAGNDNTTGSPISGATSQTYTPPVNTTGTTYYYVTVTGTCGSPLSVTSSVVEVDVNPGTGTAITSQPVSATVCPGTAAPVLSVGATGDNLTYQWYSNTANDNASGSMVNDANGNSYTPPIANTGTIWYYVVVTGDCGTVTSNAVNITVSTTGTNIITQPVAPSPVCWNGIGTVPSLSVTATGTNLSYQWYSNTTNSNSGGTIAAGQSGSAVYTPVITGAGTIYYYVVVSGDCGTVTSNAVPVTVVTGVSIISQSTLTGQQFCVGSTVPTLTVVASGVNLGYQWYRNTVPSFNNAIAIPGANGASYTPPATTIGTTYYYVTITGGCGAPLTLNSNPVPVTVTSGTGTAITTQPVAPAPLCAGGPQPVLTVAATGSNLNYTWFKNTVNSNTGGVVIGGNSSTFTLPNFPGTNYYYVTVQGSCGSATSNPVALTESITGVTVQPSGPSNVCLNSAGPLLPALLSSGASTAGVSFQWYNNTTNNNSGGTAISGAIASTYTPPTSVAGTIYYYVMATGYCNAVVSNPVPVTVNTGTGTTITAQPAAATTACVNGVSPVLTVAANGTNLLYQWFSNAANGNSGGAPINGATANTYTAPVTTPGTTWYFVTVGGVCGVVTSNVAAVNVVNGTAITSQPVAPPQVCANGNAPTLSVTASGSNLVYQWYSNTANSNSGGNAISGANGSAYIPVLTAAGTSVFYYVTVTGDCGTPLSVTSNAVQVSVVAAATIGTLLPLSNLFCINSTPLSFGAQATGTQLIFQWYSNTVNSNSGGNAIIGATNQQYNPPNTVAGTVYYYETVTSGCGTATSNPVSLTLVGAPKIITQPVAPPTICVNSASPELTVGASGTNLAYQWYSNTVNSNTGGDAINGANSDSYIPPVNAVGTTYYYVVVNAEVTAGGVACASGASNAVAVNVSGGTAITMQPVSPLPVCINGISPTLTVAASGMGLVYQWYSNTTSSNSGGSVISGAIGSSYIPAVNTAGTFYYYVTVTGTCGSPLPVASNAVSVVVVAGTTITIQPVSPDPVCVNGGSPSLSVTAQGIDLAYQWYSNTTNSNTGAAAISGANTSSYTAPVNTAGTVYYYVTVTGSCGSPLAVASNAVAVTVIGGTTIVTQPVSLSPVCVNGNPSALQVSAAGSNLSYQWYSNTTASNTGGSLISGATNATYTPVVASAGTVWYYVVITGDCGAPLQVSSNAVPITGVAGVAITGQPVAPSSVCINGTAPSLTVSASGIGLHYQWYSSLSNNNSGGAPVTGATGNAYTPPVLSTGTTWYYVTVTGDCASPASVSSDPVAINVVDATSITTQPIAPAAVCTGGTVQALSVTATGINQYQWYSNALNSNSGGSPVQGANGTVYTPPVNIVGTIWYYVIITGTCSGAPSVVTSVAVPVVVNPGVGTVITAQPSAPASICVNTSLVLHVGATGTNLGYQWYSNTTNKNSGGTLINGETGSNFGPVVSNAGTAYYYVVVSGDCGNVTSNPVNVTINAGTTISQQPLAPAAVCVGTSAGSLFVLAAGTNLVYQWYSNTTNSNSGGTLINGATNASYITQVATAGTTWYYVIVTGNCGSLDAVTSNAVAVVINGGTTINTQPVAPPAVCVNGAVASLSVAASGGDLSYQWYSNTSSSNTGGTPISGATGSSYAPSTSTAAITWYYVVVTGDCGAPQTVTSNAVVVAVSGGTAISIQPVSQQAVCAGGNGPTLSVSATGTHLSYQWYSSTTNSNSAGSPISGAIASTYAPPVSVAGTFYYFVVVTGDCGSPLTVTSNVVSVVVGSVPAIVTQPASPAPVCVNSSVAALTVDATGTNLSYQWYSNTDNNNISGGLISGATGPGYIPPVTTIGTIYYYVTVTGNCGTPVTITSNAAAVTVDAGTVINTQPVAPAPVCAGGLSPALSVAATGGGTLSYQWYNSAVNSNSGGNPIAGANTSSYTAPVGTPGTIYYYVVVTGACDITSDAVAVVVNGPTLISQQPVAPVAVCINSSAPALSVSATGAGLTYQWYSNMADMISGGDPVIGANGNEYTPPVNVSGTIYYYAVVNGSCGIATSNVIGVPVNPLTTITTDPLSPAPVCANGTAPVLTVTANAAIHYQWFSNDVNSNSGGAPVSGATGTSFTVPVNTAGTVYYYVVATGNCSAATSHTAAVTVNSTTLVTVQPATPAPLCENSVAPVLNVTATGTNLAYQWYSNASNNNTSGSSILNATGTGYTPPVNAAGTVYYYVTVTGTCGSVTSNAVAVTVNPATAIMTQPLAPAAVCLNGAAPSLTVAATGTNLNYQWYSNASNNNTSGSSILNATGTGYTPPVNTAGTVYYYVTITGSCGSITSNAIAVTVNPATAIMTQPLAPAAVCLNGAAPSLTVAATGANLNYQWYSNAANNNTTGSSILNATGTGYTPPVNTAGTVYYYVTVTGSCGSVTSNAIAVTVNPSTAIITQPLAPAAVCLNGTAPSLAVAATGPNLNYQWYSNASNNNTSGSSILNATGTGYTPPVNSEGTVYYYVTVTGTCGSVTSNAVAVTVNTATAIITQPLAPAAVCLNGTAPSLTVAATGPNLNYQWYSNTSNNNTSGSSILNATDADYTPPVNAAGTVYYYVTVAGTCGSVTSNAVAVTVNPATAIITQPLSPAAVCLNGTAPSLTVAATGTNLNYQWYSNATNNNTSGSSILNATGTGYTPPVNTAGTVYYYVTVTGTCGSVTSNAVAVTVNPATVIITQPLAPAAVCLNGTAPSLTVAATGPNLNYQWYSNTSNNNTSGSSILNATDAGYTPPVNAAGTVYYYVTVTGTCGSVTSNAVAVTVNPATAIITQPLAPAAVCLNGTAPSLTVAATGPNLNYQWYSNTSNNNTSGSSILNATDAGYTPPVNAAGTVYYYVTVTGTCGSVTSNAVAVTVNPATVIITQPIAPAAVCLNGTAPSLIVAATGTNLNYQWYSNATNNNTSGSSILGATGTGYTPPVNAAGTVYYYVTVTGSCGSVKSNAVAVVVTAGTTITTQPVSPAPVCVNGIAPVLTVAAGGSPQYQWYSNTTNSNSGGSPISLATGATYTAPVSTAGTFYYYVTVSSNCGPVASNVATVKVNALPVATITVSSSVCAVTTGNIASVASAGSGATYTWTITNGTITSGSTTNSITYTSGVSGSVTLSVTVTNSSGCKASSGNKSVTIMTFPNATITAAASVCGLSTGNTASATNTGTGGTYAWAISNGTITSGGSTANVTYTAGASGSVTLFVVVINSVGCKLSLGGKLVSINPSPNAAITTSSSVCAGSTGNKASVTNAGTGASYAWTISNGTITAGSTTSSLTYSAESSGSVTLAVKVSNSSSCSASSGNKLVTINALPVAVITAPASVCTLSTANTASVASAGSGATYSWTINNGTITSGGTTASIKFTSGASGSVTLAATVTNSSGCKASSGNKLVTISAKVVPTFNAIGPLCVGATPPALPATSGNGIAGTWSPAKISTASKGTKSYTFTPGSGQCASSTTMTITVQTCNNIANLVTAKQSLTQTTTLDAQVTPNPSETEFTLTLRGNSNQPVEVRVIDMYGKSIHYARGSANQSYKFGQRFTSGVYIVEILQGKFVKTLKIIKAK